MELAEIKIKLKERIALGLNIGLRSLSEELDKHSVYRNDLLTFQSQFNDLSQISQQNTLDYSQIEIGFNKIRVGLFSLIDKLSQIDLNTKDKLSALKNNELQYRKSNFFKLLELHMNNLEKMELIYSSNDGEEKETGREAIYCIYNELFIYGFNNPRSTNQFIVDDIVSFAHYFFTTRNNTMEVYFNTIQFLLNYIMEEEMEQDFFVGIMKSILSSAEKACLLYYSISGLDKAFTSTLIQSKLLEESLKKYLVDESHFQLLNKGI